MVNGDTPLTGLASCGAPDSDFSAAATGAVAVVAEVIVGAGSPAQCEISVDVRLGSRCLLENRRRRETCLVLDSLALS